MKYRHLKDRKEYKTIILSGGHSDVGNNIYYTDLKKGGKQSPLWRTGVKIYEGESVRDLCYEIVCKLRKLEVPAILLVGEQEDISLKERALRENRIYDMANKNTFYFELHHNGQPVDNAPYKDSDGYKGWDSRNAYRAATGTEIWTSKGLTKADKYAQFIMDNISVSPLCDDIFGTLRGYSKDKADREAQLYMLKNTKSPAVIFEWLFQTNELDCVKISNNWHRDRFVDIIVSILEKISKNK